MNIIPEPISFEWDEGNAHKNREKHNVSNQEAEELFFNEPLIVSEDIKHSDNEKRYHGLGKTNKNRMLFVSFTVRENSIRSISIRDMNKKEERIYEKA